MISGYGSIIDSIPVGYTIYGSIKTAHTQTSYYWNKQLFVTISETNGSEIIIGKKQRGIVRQL